PRRPGDSHARQRVVGRQLARARVLRLARRALRRAPRPAAAPFARRLGGLSPPQRLRRKGRVPRHPDDTSEPARAFPDRQGARESLKEPMTDVVFTNEMDEEMLLNMGPHHPSTHGVLRFIVQSDGEIIRKAVPDVGYLHRSIEKIGERCTYPGYMPYTDRVDYLAAMFANEVWAMASEKLMDIKVTPRAQYLRVISCELNRIARHFTISLGTTVMDASAGTSCPCALREREYITD